MSAGQPTLVILALHGNGGGGFRFARLHPFLPPDVYLEAPTLPGFAGEPADPRLQSLADYAAHLHGLVTAARRGDAPMVLLGTGIGGSMVLEYIQRHAADVAGVILHAPVGARLDRRRFPALMRPLPVRRLGQQVFALRLARPLLKRLLFRDHRCVPRDYLDRFFTEYGRSAAFAQMFDLITAEWFASLWPQSMPAALLWGAQERVLDPSHIEDYQRLLPGCRVRVVPEWDHFPMIEQPEAFSQEVVSLARQLVARPVPPQPAD